MEDCAWYWGLGFVGESDGFCAGEAGADGGEGEGQVETEG